MAPNTLSGKALAQTSRRPSAADEAFLRVRVRADLKEDLTRQAEANGLSLAYYVELLLDAVRHASGGQFPTAKIRTTVAYGFESSTDQQLNLQLPTIERQSAA